MVTDSLRIGNLMDGTKQDVLSPLHRQSGPLQLFALAHILANFLRRLVLPQWGRLVTDDATEEAGQDRGEDRPPCPVSDVSAGGSLRAVWGDPATG